jgi:ascorbate-specific PTS system EIIC-type component UlaA
MGLNSFNKIFGLFGIIVVILLLIFGVVILFTKYFTYIDSNVRIVMGFLIISYGSFRLVTLYNTFKKHDDEG